MTCRRGSSAKCCRWRRADAVPAAQLAQPSDIADLRQEVYVRVCEAAQKQIPDTPSPSSSTTARNLLIDRVRHEQVVPIEAVADLEALGVAVDDARPRTSAMARDELRRLQAALDRLPPRCREAVVLAASKACRGREIAQRMGITEATVSEHLTNGLRALADMSTANARPREASMSDAATRYRTPRRRLASSAATSGRGAKTTRTELDAWLARIARASRRLSGASKRAWSAGRTPRRSANPHRRTARRKPRAASVPLLFGAAAAVAAIAVCGVRRLRPSSDDSRKQTYATTVGGRETLALADGSQIELNTDTVLRIASHAHAPQSLARQGRSLFPDQARCGPSLRRAWRATTASPISAPNSSSAATTGRLEVARHGRPRAARCRKRHRASSRLLAPGDVVVATANTIEAQRNRSRRCPTNSAGARPSGLRSHHACRRSRRIQPLQQPQADRRRRENRALTIDGTFQANNVELFARVARDVLKLKVETRGDNTVVSAR